MATASEEILARAQRREKEADGLGRIITVQRLSMSKEMRVLEFTESRSEVVINHLMIAASVVDIDGVPLTFPRSRAELDAVLDRLGREGFAAAFKAVARVQEDDLPAGASLEQAAKN